MFYRQAVGPWPEVEAAVSDQGIPLWGAALRQALAVGFWGVSRSKLRICCRGLEHFSNRPATLIVCNHKCDLDLPVLMPILYGAHGRQGPIRRTAFAAAEHMFLPGYMGQYVVRRPQWLRRLLYPVNLSSVFAGIRVHSVPHSRRRRLLAHLLAARELLGNQPLTEIFSVSPQRFFPDIPLQSTIDDVLCWRNHQALDQDCGFGVFQSELARRMRLLHMDRIYRVLDEFASLLSQGDCLFFAPEGGLSLGGCFGQIKAGLGRLALSIRRPVTLLPVNITYDCVTGGRGRAFLTIGQEIEQVQDWTRQELDERVRKAVLALSTITLPQLLAQVLGEQQEQRLRVRLPEAHLGNLLFARARLLRAAGYQVDRDLLADDTFFRRWRGLLNTCERRRMLYRGRGFVCVASLPQQVRRGRARQQLQWGYWANELSTALSGQGASLPWAH